MSWTSKWRIPRVRFIASRVIAKASGRASSRAAWSRAFSLLPALGLQLAPALEIGMVELVIGRLVGFGGLEDLRAELRELGADLVVGEGLDLGLEGVRLVDQGLEASDLAVIRVDEPVQESHDRVKYRGGPRQLPLTRSGR